MAPEYALWGYLTEKADVYSFGVVALEIVSGRNNANYRPKNEAVCLLDWVNFLNNIFFFIIDSKAFHFSLHKLGIFSQISDILRLLTPFFLWLVSRRPLFCNRKEI